jgi:hypothetical protein
VLRDLGEARARFAFRVARVALYGSQNKISRLRKTSLRRKYPLDTEQIIQVIQELEAERDRLDSVIAALQGNLEA